MVRKGTLVTQVIIQLNQKFSLHSLAILESKVRLFS